VLDCTAAAALRAVRLRPVTWLTHLRVILLSLVGGALGIAGALAGELQAGGGPLLIFLGAPIIEEAMKPIGVFLALVRWPRALTNRVYRAVLCAGAGLVFGLIESTAYVLAYGDEAPDWFPLFRFTVPVALHMAASFTVGLGLDYRVVEWVNRGTRLPKRTRNFYVLGVGLHAIYNTTAVILALSGVFDP
jgi:RsiW-degrading membrane proteinase PrsW (M82 family)